MDHTVSGISSILLLLTVSSAMGAAWGQNGNAYEQELLDELTGIRNSLTDASNSNTTSSVIALAIGLILGGIAAFTAIHQTSNLKKQLTTLERQVKTIENESEIRMRPIIVRDVFQDGNVYELKKPSNDSWGKLSIKMVNRGPVIATDIGKTFEYRILAKNEYRIKDLGPLVDDPVISLGPGEHVVHTMLIPPENYDEVIGGTRFFFEFNTEYNAPDEEEYGYYMRGHFERGDFIIDRVDMY